MRGCCGKGYQGGDVASETKQFMYTDPFLGLRVRGVRRTSTFYSTLSFSVPMHESGPH